MYPKGKGSGVPSDGQAREKLALYVYEYLLHIGAQKSAQTFLSEIRWEKNITLGEPPGFLHAWWCVFWDLYCAAPDRREACEHSSEAKTFHDYSSTAAPSPVMANVAPGDGMAPSPMMSGFFQGPPGSQPPSQGSPHHPSAAMMGLQNQPFMSPRFPAGLRPSLRMPSQPPAGMPGHQPPMSSAMDPASWVQGHPSMGPMQRMSPPRGLTGMAPQSYGAVMRPPPGSFAGPGMTAMSTGPGVRSPWPNMNANSIPYSSSSPGSYGTQPNAAVLSLSASPQGPPGGGGPPGTPLLPSPGDSTNSSESMYLMNPIGPPGSRLSFSMGLSPEGAMPGMNAMEPQHMNGTLGPGEMEPMSKASPSSLAPLSNPSGTPRNDGEMGAGFLNQFHSESVRSCVERRPRRGRGSRGSRGPRGGRGAPWPGRTGPATPNADDTISYWKQGQLSEL
ncbi:single-stranded DNA-binding protein 4 isoform X1 [Zootoca vivipara]|uniref:single-stranded DNA-binding protein 4 isoform X1 n=1 Tax=Zootoca vivipara TaxID=8524 RepID=UPI00293C00FC|nr:single-stranded DNA-binding protein 4 isoform X1 [Zootoca vivipara]